MRSNLLGEHLKGGLLGLLVMAVALALPALAQAQPLDGPHGPDDRVAEAALALGSFMLALFALLMGREPLGPPAGRSHGQRSAFALMRGNPGRADARRRLLARMTSSEQR